MRMQGWSRRKTKNGHTKNIYIWREANIEPIMTTFLRQNEWDSIRKGYIWCGVNTLGDSGVQPEGQLLLTRRGKIRMDGVGIVFEFYIAPL